MNPNDYTLLLVDDTPENVHVLGEALKDFKKKVALDGRTALKIAFSESPPDMILLDVMMPEMDGYEVCRRLKAEEVTRDIPILFITAKADVLDELHGLEMGAVDYITKPLNPLLVKARVMTHLSLKLARATLEEQNRELLEAARLREEWNSRLREELELARSIQNSMLPSDEVLTGFERSGYRIFVYTQPFSEVNGDQMDVRRVGEDGFALTVADCKGHGVSAALVGMALRSAANDLCDCNVSAGRAMSELNEKLKRFVPRSEMMAATLVLRLPEDDALHVARAGAAFPLVYRHETGILEEISQGGGLLILGAGEYPDSEVRLASKDKLIFFTDGLTESVKSDDSNILFGYPSESFYERVLNHCPVDAGSCGQALISEWQAFHGGKADDDCTLVVIERV